jgi:hypothetical protein
MHLIKTMALLAMLTFGCDIATANAGTYTYSSYGFSGSNVHFSDTSLNIDNEYGGAGLIILNGSPIMNAWCVDIADWLLQPGTFNVGVDPATDVNLAGVSSITGHGKIADIGALIYYGANYAAVQLAIWETEYGSSATFAPDDLGLQAIANTYFSYLQGVWTLPADLALYELTPADALPNQRLVYLAPVPEPGSLALLSSGIFLTGMAAKRRRRRAD